jgi:hypothetical protein
LTMRHVNAVEPLSGFSLARKVHDLRYGALNAKRKFIRIDTRSKRPVKRILDTADRIQFPN